MKMSDPTKDGIDHINIYSQGKTNLGQYLSNWAYAPTVLLAGTFDSLEGYWFFLYTGNDMFKTLSGWEAKKEGQDSKIENRQVKLSNNPLFRKRFGHAMREKVRQHPDLLKMLQDSFLPFTHYYVMQGRVVNAGHEWVTEEWEKIRQELMD